MHLTFVKKIFADGTPCKKCREVSERMEAEGLLELVNYIAIADERDIESEGMRLAIEFGATRAPFFLVEHAGKVELFDVYFKLKKYLTELGLAKTKESTL
jgi:hypothetical protein